MEIRIEVNGWKRRANTWREKARYYNTGWSNNCRKERGYILKGWKEWSPPRRQVLSCWYCTFSETLFKITRNPASHSVVRVRCWSSFRWQFRVYSFFFWWPAKFANLVLGVLRLTRYRGRGPFESIKRIELLMARHPAVGVCSFIPWTRHAALSTDSET